MKIQRNIFLIYLFNIFFIVSCSSLFSMPKCHDFYPANIDLSFNHKFKKSSIESPNEISCRITEFLDLEIFEKRFRNVSQKNLFKDVFKNYTPCIAEIGNDREKDVQFNVGSFLKKIGNQRILPKDVLKYFPKGMRNLTLWQGTVLGIKIILCSGIFVGVYFGGKAIGSAALSVLLEFFAAAVLNSAINPGLNKLFKRKIEKAKEPQNVLGEIQKLSQGGNVIISSGDVQPILFFVKKGDVEARGSRFAGLRIDEQDLSPVLN